MPSFIPVSRDNHAGKRWLRHTSYGFAADRALIPLVAAELTKAAPAMPIAFIEENAALHLVAVMSLKSGKNQFVAADGRWLGAYIPAAMRSYPFALLHPEGVQEPIMCIDTDSDLIVDAGTPGAEPFFDEEGAPALPLKNVLDFLGQVEANRAATSRAVTALAAADVLTPWPLQVTTPAGQQTVTGLQRVDEARLNALDSEGFLGLRAVGGLGVAYAQMLSVNQLGVFETLAKLQAQISGVHAQQQAAFDNSFLSPASEALQFDFSRL